MANRFNTYTKVDYVNLPIDAYGAAMQSEEIANLSKLESMKSTYDKLQNVEAVHNPDRLLRDKIFSDMDTQIDELTKKDLKSSDALMQLNRMVNDRSTINQLSAIQGNTDAYRKALSANQKYQADFGNDINTVRMQDEKAAYDKLDVTGFKEGLFAGYQPNKFVDITKDLHEALKEVEANKFERTFSDGKWIWKKGTEVITMEDLMKRSGIMLNDPKYQSQLKELAYYSLRNYGTGPEAVTAYNLKHAEALDGQINKYSSVLTGLQSDRKKLLSKLTTLNKNSDQYKKIAMEAAQMEKQIEDASRGIKSLSASKGKYLNDKTGAALQEDLLSNLAGVASSPFHYNRESLTQVADPYGLATHKAGLALRNAEHMFNKKRKADLEDRSYEENKSLPTPVIMDVQINKDKEGNAIVDRAVVLSADGGFVPQKIHDTVLAAIQNQTEGSDQFDAPVTLSTKKKEEISKALKSGQGSVSYIFGTKELAITTPNGIVRVSAPKQMQEEMAPLYRIAKANENGSDDRIMRTQLSLDGEQLRNVVVYSPSVLDAPKNTHYLFVPSAAPVIAREDFDKMDKAEFKKATGFEQLSPQAFKHYSYLPGVYVAYTYDYRNQNYTERVDKIGTIEEMRKDLAQHAATPIQTLYFQSMDGKIQKLDEHNTQSLEDIQSKHVRYYSKKGGSFSNMKDQNQYKTSKVKYTDRSSESEINSFSDNNPDE